MISACKNIKKLIVVTGYIMDILYLCYKVENKMINQSVKSKSPSQYFWGESLTLLIFIKNLFEEVRKRD